MCNYIRTRVASLGVVSILDTMTKVRHHLSTHLNIPHEVDFFFKS